MGWINGHPEEDGFYLIDYGPCWFGSRLHERFRVVVIKDGLFKEYIKNRSSDTCLSRTTFQYMEIEHPDE